MPEYQIAMKIILYLNNCSCIRFSLYSADQKHTPRHSKEVNGTHSRLWFLIHRRKKLLKLLFCPELHIISLAFPDTSCFPAWIIFQVIISDCIIEKCCQLVIDTF